MTSFLPCSPLALLALAAALLIPPLAAPDAPPADSDLTVCQAPRNLRDARRQARRLVADVREELVPVEDEVRNVPFLDALEAGTASLEQIAAVAAEQYSIIKSDWSSFAQMTGRFQDAESRRFFGSITAGEDRLRPAAHFAAAVGLDERDLLDYEPRPEAQTYPWRVAWIAANADRAAAGASFLVNFAVFGENMGRLTEALIEVYDFSPDEVACFAGFAGVIPGFEDSAIEVIAAGLHRGECPREFKRSARLLQAYELDFWLAVGEPPGSQLPVERP